jgi:hypothetical protein
MKLTKRGKRVRAIMIIVIIALVWWVSGHIWWTDGYCVGTIEECGL